MAAALFGLRIARPDGPDTAGAVEDVSIASAGLLPGGYASPPEVVEAMAELDVDLSGHRSTQVSPELVAAADLVLGLGRRHAREVVLMDPTSWPRTFTLKELVRRGDTVGPRAAGEPVAGWLARLHKGRERTGLVGSSPDDDVSDPLGGPLSAYRATARELGALADAVAGLLWAPRPIRPLPG
jgi:protein-tyrosine-phosphatase